jgi:hypothetical protein
VKIKIIHAMVIIYLVTGISLLANSLEVNAQPQEVLKKYENPKLGINFQYPSEWGEAIDLNCDVNRCGPIFMIWAPAQNTSSNTTQQAMTPAQKAKEAAMKASEEAIEDARKALNMPSREQNFFIMGISAIELDRPSSDHAPCDCSTLKDFVAWDYTSTPNEGRTL